MAVDTLVQSRGVDLAKRRSLLIEIAIVAAIALFLIFALPWLISAFRLNLMGRFLALAIVALGIDLIWGFTGLLSLGHGIFFTIGGYALAMHLKLPQPPGSGLPEFMSLYGGTELPWFWRPFYSAPFSLFAIAVIPAVIAGILGYVIFRNRIRGVYFSILTQAATIIFFNFFNGQQKLFNGTNGLTDFRSVFGLPVKDNRTQYILYIVTILFVILAYAVCRWLTSGRFGRLLVAIRDDESRVRFTGYNPTGFKILVFAVSGALAGIAGALYTLQSGIVSPNTMNIAFSIEMVIWVAVGGRATLVGAILGAVLVNLAKSLLSEQFPDFWLFFQGGLFLLVVLLLPSGLIGWLRTSGVDLYKQLTGQTRLSTYPSLEEDPEVEYERKNIGD
ncbi:MAG: urea ABC transporter permease subunit UrtC [Cyanobacteria bacterium J069]|nr:MAG: urea ABC transporter permease subunit UrtC [Cyanobacteria bacterium J069]